MYAGFTSPAVPKLKTKHLLNTKNFMLGVTMNSEAGA